jgi:hypothetical protein
MKDEHIEQSSAPFPFHKIIRDGRITFRQTLKHSGTKEGAAMVVEHHGHDHLSLVFRELYESASGRQDGRIRYRWTLDTKGTVQLASVLFLIAENHMRDSDEEPHTIILDPDRASFGPNWICEDYQSAVMRTENLKKRSHLFGLMKRFVELCDDEEYVKYIAANLAFWADRANDEFAAWQAEKTLFQLGMVCEDLIN